VKTRPATTSNVTGSLFQVLVVGVLLFAVFWQISGSIDSDSNTPAPDVSRVESTAEPFMTTDDVNLRRGPGLDHEVITVVPLHAEVLVTGSSQNGFVPVDLNGTSAWVAESYVVPEGSVFGGTTEDLAVADVPEPAVAAPEPTEVPTSAPTAVPTEAVAQVVIEEAPVTVTQDVAAEVSVAEIEPEPVHDVVDAPVVASTFADTTEPDASVESAQPGERWVEVDRTKATVTLHEGEFVVAQFPALIGKDPSTDGYYATATGTFYVHMKTRELTETPFAPGVYLTDFVGFDPERSNGFHSPTRDAAGNVVQTGGTTTLGCVRLGEEDARQMFDFAFIGMRVEIHD
jgi:lipoprotein-anchoring transpeptidase ErfK/SrfK